jgi:hypothetical protein
MRSAAAFPFLLTAILAASPAQAVIHAYVLVETAPEKTAAVVGSQWGFGNCKALIHSFQSAEIVAHVACNDAESLNVVVTKDLPAKDGVTRVSVWSVFTAP